jgi:transposase-like protein
MAKTRPAYPPEFRRQMIELVHAARSPEELAREFEPTAQGEERMAANRGRGGNHYADACCRPDRDGSMRFPGAGSVTSSREAIWGSILHVARHMGSTMM